MTEPGPDGLNLTWQQLLAAYADRELDDVQRDRAEEILMRVPAAEDELRAQRRFSPENQELWRAVRISEPAPHRWADVCNNIEAASRRHVAPSGRGGLRSPWLRRGLLALALALPTTAAASVALVMTAGPANRPAVNSPPEVNDDVLRVVQPDDVEIESIGHRDRPGLVVGQPPLGDSMTLVSKTDVTLDDVQPDQDGFLPQVQTGGDATMIIVPPREP